MSGRIRTIKPELLDDEVAAGLSDAAWRLWVSTWTLADDHGNFRLGSKFLAAKVWHDTTRDAEEPLRELILAGRIEPYAVRGQRYGHVVNWEKHQRIDNAGKPRVPNPSENDHSWNLSEFLRELPRLAAGPRPRPPTTDHEQGPSVPPPVGSGEPTFLLSPPESPPSSQSEETGQQGAAIREVFDHWVTGWKRVVGGTRPPKLDTKRRGKIRAALANYTVADICRAIDGLWASDFHIRTKHWDIELVCRDAPHTDRFLAMAPERPSGTYAIAHPAEPLPIPAWLDDLEANETSTEPQTLLAGSDR